MIQVTVRPAGSKRESRYVLVLALIIVLIAALVAWSRVTPIEHNELKAWQIDARHQLNAAEQGLNADLNVAVEEIQFALNQQQEPSLAYLESLYLPPFIKDSTRIERGAHEWQKYQTADDLLYLGISSDVAIAGHMLLRISRQTTASLDPQYDSWINHKANVTAASVNTFAFDDASLIALGFKQIISEYDKSVTRH